MAELSDGILDFGEVAVPVHESQGSAIFRAYIHDWGVRRVMFYEDVQYVRTWIRKMRRGEIDASGYRVTVVFVGGEIQTWEFDNHVGWPIVDDVQTNTEYAREVFK